MTAACSGWRSAAWRNREWMAASRWLRVLPVLCRSRSSMVRKPLTVAAPTSAKSRLVGRMPDCCWI
jgi:hypothetical protein